MSAVKGDENEGHALFWGKTRGHKKDITELVIDTVKLSADAELAVAGGVPATEDGTPLALSLAGLGLVLSRKKRTNK